jgi:hypothetical protein
MTKPSWLPCGCSSNHPENEYFGVWCDEHCPRNIYGDLAFNFDFLSERGKAEIRKITDETFDILTKRLCQDLFGANK